jgi:hypothetical protein
MEQILLVREYIVKIYKRFEPFIAYFVKFLIGAYVFGNIQNIGQPHEMVAPFLEAASGFSATLMLGLAFALLPYTLSWFLMVAGITLQYSAHLEMAVMIFIGLSLILFFYARIAAKESILILLTALAFHFKLPYLVPLFAGLYASMTTVIPVALGIFLWSYIPVMQGLVATTRTAGLNFTEMPATFGEVYNAMAASLTATQPWFFTAFIFAMVIIIVHVVSRLSIDFSKDIAIALGCALNIFGFIVAVLVAGEDIAIWGVVGMTLLCGVIAEAVRFFDVVLDYQRAESVQFEDEQNYYYVRVVQKVVFAKRRRAARRARPPAGEGE